MFEKLNQSTEEHLSSPIIQKHVEAVEYVINERYLDSPLYFRIMKKVNWTVMNLEDVCVRYKIERL